MKDELAIFNKPKSKISENIRTIRTNLQFTFLKDGYKTLLITSSIPGEGKSFISSNLAIAFAQAGDKVLLVDADLRLGRLHKIFDVSNEMGFSNLLIEEKTVKLNEYVKKTKIPNLSVLPRGTVPPNPSELLNSQTAKTIIEKLKKSYDYILFDSVPINGFPDSLVMARLVDGVALVCANDYTKTDDLTESTKALENISANVVGIIANKVNPRKKDKYYHYYSE